MELKELKALKEFPKAEILLVVLLSMPSTALTAFDKNNSGKVVHNVNLLVLFLLSR